MALDYTQLVTYKKQYLRGATAEQKTAINYFIPNTGCTGLFGGVKDEEYDAIIKKLVATSNSYQKALDKIGLDESELKEIPPVTFYGYENSDFSKSNPDGTFRSNLYTITHIFFSATQVYAYSLTINTMKNEKKERTEEYFYKDVTNFSTLSDTIESLQFGGCFGGPKRVSVELQKFSLIVPGDKFTVAVYGDIDQSVKAMKNKLREKKG